MGLYYEQDYYGVKFLDKNNTELYKTIYYEKMNKEDVEKVKIKYRELKEQYGKIQIFLNLFPPTIDLDEMWKVTKLSDTSVGMRDLVCEANKGTSLTWVFVPESEFLS